MTIKFYCWRALQKVTRAFSHIAPGRRLKRLLLQESNKAMTNEVRELFRGHHVTSCKSVQIRDCSQDKFLSLDTKAMFQFTSSQFDATVWIQVTVMPDSASITPSHVVYLSNDLKYYWHWSEDESEVSLVSRDQSMTFIDDEQNWFAIDGQSSTECSFLRVWQLNNQCVYFEEGKLISGMSDQNMIQYQWEFVSA